jgi:transmembrane sensor
MFSANAETSTLDAAWKGIGARRVRARRVRQVWIGMPVVAALALVVLFVLRRSEPAHEVAHVPQVIALAGGAPLPPMWSGATTPVTAFDDGSHLELSPDARIRVRGEEGHRDPSRVELVLEEGTATFDIEPGGPRAWVVGAGDTTVRVLGTRFIVARTKESDRIHVSVARGKVRVESPRLAEGTRDLVAGQEIDVATPSAGSDGVPVATVDDLASVPAPPALPRPDRTRPSRPPPAVTTSPARSTAGLSPRPSAPPPSTAERMDHADAARRAGRPREAVAILASIVEDADPRSAIAAFTIGKVHAEELGDPAGAASWFERASRLGLPAALDEDAHARVVECYARAGRNADAARAASSYEAKFPDGRHLARVKRWTNE